MAWQYMGVMIVNMRCKHSDFCHRGQLTCRISRVCEINNFCYYFYNAIGTTEATHVYWDSDQCIGPKILVVWLVIELG